MGSLVSQREFPSSYLGPCGPLVTGRAHAHRAVMARPALQCFRLPRWGTGRAHGMVWFIEHMDAPGAFTGSPA